jgi:polyisoprenoid-binding protein YceI
MKVSLVIGLVGAMAAGVAVSGDAQTRYNSQPSGISVKIEGTSTTHDWEMQGAIIGGFAQFGPGVTLDPAQSAIAGLNGDTVPVTVHAHIPVRSIHSEAEHAPDVMDHLMQNALLADQFSQIGYTLTTMTFKGPHTAGQPFAFDTMGDLSIAGVTNKVSFPVTIEVVAPDRIQIHAAVPLKMTAFHIDPPAPNIGLGLMRCGDDVTIKIDWTLKERKAAP